jgi:hypothetical protein
VEFTQFLTTFCDGEPITLGRSAVCDQDGHNPWT